MPDDIEVIEIASWDEFITYLRTSSLDVADYFYRGQSDPSWALVPTLQRKLKPEYPFATRDAYNHRVNAYLRAFRDHAHGLIGFPDGLTTLDPLLSLGRHHGLLTPILDWTRSPYVAAFFALKGVAEKVNMPLDHDRDSSRGIGGKEIVAIWRYQVEADGNIFEVDSYGKVKDFLRFFTEVGFPNLQQKAQSGVYMHLDTHEYQSVDDLLRAKGKTARLQKWILEVDVAEAIGDLALMNIHIGSMFPDLSHAAQQANNRMNYPDTFF
jgi:hypothetical protein